MKKIIFFIILITSSIFITSCSNKQVEQPTSDNINSQVSTNEQTQLTPTTKINDNIPTPTSISNNTTSPDASIHKADNPDNFVSTSFSDTTDEYSYSIPKIDINSDDVKAINKEIQNEFRNEVDEEIAYYQQGFSVFMYNVQYESYINGTILSLLISREYPDDFIVYQTYNVDVSTGNSISNTQLLQYKNITDSNFLNKLPKLYNDEFIMQNGTKDTHIENMKTAPAGFSEEEIEDFSKQYTDKYNMTLDKSNYGIDTPMYLDSSGNLNIIAKIYSLAGSDLYYNIITVEK